MVSMDVEAIAAVSYTHLDVYKRQDIRYDKQQPLIAFVYDNDEMSVPTLDDFINSQTDFLSKNDYVYYVAFEFCK